MCAACVGQPKPLVAPLSADHTLPAGLRVVLLDSDLPALAQTAALSLAKQSSVPLDAWTIAPLPQSATLEAGVWPLAISQLKLAWTPEHRLRATFAVPAISGLVSVALADQASCPLTWSAASGQAAVELEVLRSSTGQATVQRHPPGDELSVTWQSPQLTEAGNCFASLAADAPKLVSAHLALAVGDALTQAVAAALVPPVRAVFASSLEVSGRLPVSHAHGQELEARVDLAFAPATPGAPSLVGHAGGLTTAAAAVGVDVDRHPCAVDLPIPSAVVAPLALPPPHTSPAFLRRALVVDAAMIQRLAWLSHRAGFLCASASTNSDLGAALAPGWAADVLPELEPWLDGPPVDARFWPGPPPQTRLLDTPAGPGIEWSAEGATLEIVARMAHTDVVVLTMTGSFRAILLPQLLSNHTLEFQVVTVERLSTHQSSPVLGDLNAPSEAQLSHLCSVAMQGIFANRAVLPLLGLEPSPLPAGTVLSRIDRTGDALWLWLEGGGG